MDTNTITTNGIRFLEGHVCDGCNAYCRGGTHAQVLWFPPNKSDQERRNSVQEVFGLPVVALEPAPEAARTDQHWVGWDGSARARDFDVARLATFKPYLFIFRTEEES